MESAAYMFIISFVVVFLILFYLFSPFRIVRDNKSGQEEEGSDLFGSSDSGESPPAPPGETVTTTLPEEEPYDIFGSETEEEPEDMPPLPT